MGVTIPDPCVPYNRSQEVTGLSGTITWAERSQRCHLTWKWTIRVPRRYGIVLDFHHVQLNQRYLTIHSYPGDADGQADGQRDGQIPDGQIPPTKERLFSSYDCQNEYGYLHLYPLLIKKSHVTVSLVHFGMPQLSFMPSNFFNLTFYAQEPETMPSPISYDSLEDGFHLLDTMASYNCSGATVPAAFRCNMIKECVGDEDERGCPYRSLGCGDWIPYKRQCLKFTVQEVPEVIVWNHDLQHVPKMCEDHYYGATLATMPDKAGLSFVAFIARHMGACRAYLFIKKMAPKSSRHGNMYRFLWQWGGKGGPVAYDQPRLERHGGDHSCSLFVVHPVVRFVAAACSTFQRSRRALVCMKPNPRFVSGPSPTAAELPRSLQLPAATRAPIGFATKECADGSLVQTFHRCHWVEGPVGAGAAGAAWSRNGFVLFQCVFGEPIHYSLVCDGHDDCADGSDESGCAAPTFPPLKRPFFACDNHQLVPRSKYCDGKLDCLDKSDELSCTSCSTRRMELCPGIGCVDAAVRLKCGRTEVHLQGKWPVPGLLELTGDGTSVVVPADSNGTGEGMFECHSGFLIPSYLLNNGEKDCFDGKDETFSKDGITCPGYYRCQDYGNCLHGDLVCDGIYHCPNKDDELYCDTACPSNCTCEGYAFLCREMFDPLQHLQVRYLHISTTHSNFSFDNFHVMELLQFLNMSACRLKNVTLLNMPRLRRLYLSFNQLTDISSNAMENLEGLKYLDLSGNPFVKTLDSTFSEFMLKAGLHHVNVLIMKQMQRLVTIEDNAFGHMSKLKRLDFRGNAIEKYGVNVFKGLEDIAMIETDDPRLCCPYYKPGSAGCVAPDDELSSCNDLLRNDFFRVSLWVLSCLAVAGNAGVLAYRVLGDKQRTSPVFRALVVSLCASDLLMGVYMMVIGSADVLFRDVYVSRDKEWRRSTACQTAGFLAFLSSEVSAFTICLITLDRLLVIGFPLKKHLHLTVAQCVAACAVAWLAGLALAVVPLLSGLEFYEQNAICLPLPITQRQFTGKDYTFGVFIVLNFFLMLFTGAGQVFIYWAFRSAGTASGSGSGSGSQSLQQEMVIARRLFLVVLSDFCCWFPIGLMGLLASSGFPISEWVNVWAAVFVLPLNSALNPFLYTLNSLLERWRKQRDDDRTKRLVRKLQTQIPTWSAGIVAEVLKTCVGTKLVPKEKICQWLGIKPGAPQIADTERVLLEEEKRSSKLNP